MIRIKMNQTMKETINNVEIQWFWTKIKSMENIYSVRRYRCA